MLDHHIFKECHYGNILKLANRNNTWKKWAVPEFVWHGLKGSIFEEEPIKPKQNHEIIIWAKKNIAVINNTLNLTI